MKKQIAVIVGLMVLLTGGLFAQATKDVTMTVTLGEWYDLSIDKGTLSFSDVAPALGLTAPATRSIAANEGVVSVRAFSIMKATKELKLEVKANSDLTDISDATNKIGIGAISWTASGTGYNSNGTISTETQKIGSWTGSAYNWRTGTFTFSFARDYTTQAPGTYTASVTYTLSVV